MTNMLITGGTNGLGCEIIKACSWAKRIYNVSPTQPELTEPNETWIRGDVRNHDPWIRYIGEVHILINNAGVNAINWLESVTPLDWDEIMDTNAKGIFLVTQALVGRLTHTSGTVLNIVSNASHVPMTASLAYNASKAAAHIMTLQLARELTKKNKITVFGISPAKLRGTRMSKQIEKETCAVRRWDNELALAHQESALVTGEEIDPAVLAEFISWLLEHKERHYWLSGCVVPYGA